MAIAAALASKAKFGAGVRTKRPRRSSSGPEGAAAPSQSGGDGASSAGASQLPHQASILSHQAAFHSLLHLIPPKHYLVRDEAEDDEAAQQGLFGAAARFQKNKRNKDKEAEIAAKKERARQGKRAKLDPENMKDVMQVQKERAQEAERKKGKVQDDDEDDEDEDEEDEKDEDEDDDDEDNSFDMDIDGKLDGADASQLSMSGAAKKAASNATVGNGGPAKTASASIQELRARLHARIEGLQKRRQVTGTNNTPLGVGAGSSRGAAAAGGDNDDDDAGSMAGSKDELLEERRRKRGEMRDRRRRERKEQRRAAANAAAAANSDKGKKKDGGAAASAKGAGANSMVTRAPALLVGDRPDSRKDGAGGRGAAVNVKEGDVAFSSLKFDSQGDSVAGGKGAKLQSKYSLPSDPKSALAVLEARKRKEEKRREKLGEDKAGERDERDKWEKVEAAAMGVKIRDDESRLKKAAKRKDKEKQKSSNEWAKREYEQTKQQADRQKKRTENLAARKSGGKGAKGSKGKTGGAPGGGKKGTKARPGFEGKRGLGGGGAKAKGAKAGGKGGPSKGNK